MSVITSQKTLSQEDKINVEIMKCCASPAFFIDNYCYLDDSQGEGDGSGAIQFKLRTYQTGFVWTLDQEKLVIALKARQLGVSWLVCAYELWRAIFKNTQLILLFSIGETEAIELLRRVKRLYERLPQWMRERYPQAKRPNTQEMEFSNGSRILSLASSEAKGSGFSASSCFLDEFAKNPVADNLFAAIMPTVEAGTSQLIIVSTAYGVGGKYHEIWTKASRGESEFKSIFFPWWVVPGRDAAWYQKQIDTETDPERVKENYPSNPTEAFRTSGTARFKQTWIEAQSVNVSLPLPSMSIKSELANLESVEIYELPKKMGEYIIGADPAEGVGADFDDAVVIDTKTWTEVAHLSGQWEPDYFAKQLIVLSNAYNRAMVAVERNNHGHAVVVTFKLLGFADVTQDDDRRYGIKTNLKSKPEMIDGLAEALRDNLIKIRSQSTLDEMLVYRREPNGATSAPPSFHDDSVMAWAIGLAAVRKPQEQYNIGPAVEVKLEQKPLFSIHPDPEIAWNRQLGHAKDSKRDMTEMVERFKVNPRRSFYGR